MPLITDYTALPDLRDFRRITTPTDLTDDSVMALAITAASRAIDTHCGRKFGQEDTAVARVYSWSGTYLEIPAPNYARTGYGLQTNSAWGGYLPSLEVDDIGSVTGLVLKTDGDGDGTYETTLTINTDFRMWPLNALSDGEPFTHVVLQRGGFFPWAVAGVQITAHYGWPAVPPEVEQACMLQANRLCGRRDSWSGVAGSPDLGNELRLLSKLDPDLGPLLAGRRRMWMVG